MMKRRTPKVRGEIDGSCVSERVDDPTSRLVAANGKVQSDFVQRVAFGAADNAERQLLNALFSQLPIRLFVKDLEGRFLVANDAVAKMNGFQRGEELIGKTDFDLFSEEVAQRFYDAEQTIMSGGEPMFDSEVMRKNSRGETEWLRSTKLPLRDDTGKIIGLIGMSQDITERKNVEEQLEAERMLFRAMIDQVPDYLFVKDKESRFVVANKAVASDLGLQPDELIGKTDFELHQHDLAEKFYSDEQKVIGSGEPFIDTEDMVLDTAGKEKWFATSKVPLRDAKDDVIGIVGVCRDVTDRKKAEERIRHMALHDGLTGLPNRTLLMDRIEQGILQSKRSSIRLTMLFIDLDNFKTINDSLGHKAGDTLLKTVADRMVNAVRASDTVARLGGDEFVILLVDRDSSKAPPAALFERIRAVIAEPIVLEGISFQISGSIGVARYPEDGVDGDTLLKNADIAMYAAKDSGRDGIKIYDQAMEKPIQ